MCKHTSLLQTCNGSGCGYGESGSFRKLIRSDKPFITIGISPKLTMNHQQRTSIAPGLETELTTIDC